MADTLSDEQIVEALRGLSGWDREGAALVRSVELPSFPRAIQVVNRVAEIAENNNHHPDIDIRWRTLVFRCTTHSKGGITQADVSLAEEIDGVVEALAQS
ncbi:4a-hydroxytetrahydrobiopterin dehydratase [Gandjariella thermophila]|uniref:Putative pterin-4-alpha-carbinolamine dehydratase n=1 Tax=Gandjariella thermophila TaxID=1931992 RepID=A0A4D4J0G9_9PSEU|nr:4a-hydroxytetrahydrobiopterin dehydratase [Gandjariella thermophila]GDY29951.1 4a-hydroxytetrahydrobiopterin dehydratase [Gandjariella thermophila]